MFSIQYFNSFFFFLCNNLRGIMATLTSLEKIGSSKMSPLS